MITNRDMARFAELATAGYGPVAVGSEDWPAYSMLRRLGYVSERKGLLYINRAGYRAAMTWLTEPALARRRENGIPAFRAVHCQT